MPPSGRSVGTRLVVSVSVGQLSAYRGRTLCAPTHPVGIGAHPFLLRTIPIENSQALPFGGFAFHSALFRAEGPERGGAEPGFARRMCGIFPQ